MSTIHSPINRSKRPTGILVAAVAACVVVIVAVAAFAGIAYGHSISHNTPSAPSHTVTPLKPVVPSGATAAIKKYETQNGPGAGKWVIRSSQVSKANPKYVFVQLGAAKGFEDSVQGGYGFAASSGSSWQVVGFGSALVGCPMSGSHTAVVPTAVLKEFGFACPPA
jgi:hypothetical protein